MRDARDLSDSLQACICSARKIEWRAEVGKDRLATEKLERLRKLVEDMKLVSADLAAETDEVDELQHAVFSARKVKEEVRQVLIKIYKQDRTEDDVYLDWLQNKLAERASALFLPAPVRAD